MIDFDNILTGEEADDLFGTSEESQEQDGDVLFAPLEELEENKTTENLESGEDASLESVGDDEDNNGESAQSTTQGVNPSPRFYASIAKALADEGVFSDFNITDDDLKVVKTAEDFVNLAKKWSQSIREADDQRILQATQAGVEPERIRQYEQTLRQLENVKDETLKGENQEASQWRKQIIYQDYINRGFTQERALKATERSFAAGTDIEDAIDSLTSVKEYFSEAYNKEISESKKGQEAIALKVKQESEQLKKDLLDSSEPINGMKVDKAVRQQAYDALVKPIAKDSKGNSITAIQKFEQENPLQFRKALGVLYALTNGFKDVSKVVDHQAKIKARKGMSELEKTLLSSGSKIMDGSFQLAGAGGYNDFNVNEGFLLGE